MPRPILLRLLLLLSLLGLAACLGGSVGGVAGAAEPTTLAASHLAKMDVDKEDWKAKTHDWWAAHLTPLQVQVCRDAGTERPFTGAHNAHKGPGTFLCSSCGLALFDAQTKFDSGTGWPSFFDTLPGAVKSVSDTSLGMTRVEVRCRRCDAHLGHVFEDGPKPTGLRYCINSVCLLTAGPPAPK